MIWSKARSLALIPLLLSTSCASANRVSDSKAAIEVGQEACGTNHRYQHWEAAASGTNWSVIGSTPLRFTAMGECRILVPQDGSAPFNRTYYPPPNVPGCEPPSQTANGCTTVPESPNSVLWIRGTRLPQ